MRIKTAYSKYSYLRSALDKAFKYLNPYKKFTFEEYLKKAYGKSRNNFTKFIGNEEP